MKKKRLLSGLLIAGLLATPAFALADTMPPGYHKDALPITVHADGAYVPTDVEPYITAGRTMVPLRAAGEAMDASVAWDGNTRCISVLYDSREVYFFADSTIYYVNGETKTTDVAPQIKDGRTMLPLRVFAESLNAQVDWDGTLRDVQIDTDKADAPAPTIPIGTQEDMATLIQKYYVTDDPSDPLVGSWKHLGHGYNSTIYTYHFISKNADGTYNDIWPRLTYVQTSLIQDIIIRANTLTGSPSSLIGQNSYNSVIYSQGPNRGYDQPETYYYKLDSEHNLLTATGYYISAYGESKFEPLNDIYNRF